MLSILSGPNFVVWEWVKFNSMINDANQSLLYNKALNHDI